MTPQCLASSPTIMNLLIGRKEMNWQSGAEDQQNKRDYCGFPLVRSVQPLLTLQYIISEEISSVSNSWG